VTRLAGEDRQACIRTSDFGFLSSFGNSSFVIRRRRLGRWPSRLHSAVDNRQSQIPSFMINPRSFATGVPRLDGHYPSGNQSLKRFRGGAACHGLTACGNTSSHEWDGLARRDLPVVKMSLELGPRCRLALVPAKWRSSLRTPLKPTVERPRRNSRPCPKNSAE
jgi:hypothetical protein